jgi:GAF domain-containing protein
MGKQLLEYYQRADALGGIQAKVRLAGITGVTSTQAGGEPDTKATLATFEQAFKIVTGEFKPQDARSAAAPIAFTAPASNDAQEKRLRRYNKVVAECMVQRALFFKRPEDTYSRLTEAAAEGLECARASIWFYDRNQSVIRCADLFERENGGKHSAGVELGAKDFPAYFRALETARTIPAHDAHQDPRTAEFSKVYLTPLKITSMLDVPIWVDDKMVGVVCHEHIGPRRTWNADDENFAYTIAGLVALAEELKRERSKS